MTPWRKRNWEADAWPFLATLTRSGADPMTDANASDAAEEYFSFLLVEKKTDDVDVDFAGAGGWFSCFASFDVVALVAFLLFVSLTQNDVAVAAATAAVDDDDD